MYHELGLPASRAIASLSCIQVVTHHPVCDIGHIRIVEGIGGAVADAGLEAFQWGEVHVLRIGHGCTVYDEIVGESLIDMLVDLRTPDTVAVALHSLGLRQDLCCQQHLFGLGCLHTENHTVVFVFGRDDGLREQSGHHPGRKLRFLASGGFRRLCVLHCFCRCLGVEEQGQGLAQEVLGVHPGMAELVVGVLLHTGDAVLVEELHIVAGIAIEEIIRTDTQPEKMDLAVCVSGIVVHTGNLCRGKRTVAAQIRELVEMTQSIMQSLVAAARETADGTMVGIVDGAVVMLDIRHEVIVQIQTEDILAKHGLGHTGDVGHRWQQLVGIAVGQHHNHLLGLAFSQQIVEDIVHAAYLVVHLLRIRRAADQVEHGIFLPRILLVLRWQIHHGLIGGTQTLGVVVDILQTAVGHVEDVVRQFAAFRRYLQQ